MPVNEYESITEPLTEAKFVSVTLQHTAINQNEISYLGLVVI